MRVRVVLGLALLGVIAVFVIEMSGRAVRTAGSDHTSAVGFSATVPAGGVLCQPAPFLPKDAKRMQFVLGTYGHPVPSLYFSFTAANGALSASAYMPAGGREGPATLALRRVRGAPEPTNVCVRVGDASEVVLAGETGPVNSGSELVNGKPQPGRVGLVYLRGGAESWWQLLPILDERLGFGKAPFFGDWTLPALALLLLGAWIASLRLLVRELP